MPVNIKFSCRFKFFFFHFIMLFFLFSLNVPQTKYSTKKIDRVGWVSVSLRVKTIPLSLDIFVEWLTANWANRALTGTWVNLPRPILTTFRACMDLQNRQLFHTPEGQILHCSSETEKMFLWFLTTWKKISGHIQY